MQVAVQSGEIRLVKADAMIVTINTNCRNADITTWSDLVDLAGATLLPDGHTITTRGNGLPSVTFDCVMVLVDNFEQPLSQIVKVALTAANEANFQTITLPPLRMQALPVGNEGRKRSALQIAQGVGEFIAENPSSRIQLATFVVNRNPEIWRLLREALHLRP